MISSPPFWSSSLSHLFWYPLSSCDISCESFIEAGEISNRWGVEPPLRNIDFFCFNCFGDFLVVSDEFFDYSFVFCSFLWSSCAHWMCIWCWCFVLHRNLLFPGGGPPGHYNMCQVKLPFAFVVLVYVVILVLFCFSRSKRWSLFLCVLEYNVFWLNIPYSSRTSSLFLVLLNVVFDSLGFFGVIEFLFLVFISRSFSNLYLVLLCWVCVDGSIIVWKVVLYCYSVVCCLVQSKIGIHIKCWLVENRG